SNHAKSAQFSAVFVRNDVVRIVRPHSNITKGAFRSAFEDLACEYAIGTIGPSCSIPQHARKIFASERMLRLPCRDFEVWFDLQLVRFEVGNVVLRNVVTGSVENLR